MRTRPVAVAALLAGAVLLLGAGTAAAHGGGSTDGAVSVAQTLGSRELTVTLYPPPGGVGDMPVRIAEQSRVPGPPAAVAAVPVDGPGAGRPTSTASVPTSPGTADPASLRIDGPGRWEVVLSSGRDVGRIPLDLPAAPATPTWVWMVRGGVAVAVLAGIAATASGRRRPRLATGLGGVALVGVTVVVTAAMLSGAVPPTAPSPVPDGRGTAGTDTAAMPGMDMAGMDMAGAHGAGAVVLTATARPPGPGGPAVLDLALGDGSSGAPVDDLVVHDDAFVHLAVIGPGNRLWHVHPVRVAPGQFVVELPQPVPGAYGLFAELERAEGGHQVARTAVPVGTGVPGPTAPTGGAGPRETAGMRVDVTTGAPVAGRASRVELVFSAGGAPVRDLQAWLGMAGHLMILGPGPAAGPSPVDPTTSFAHVHDMGAPGPGPRGTGTIGNGPAIGFTYAFPAAGRYQLWAQVQRDRELVTVPITVDVAPSPRSGTP